MLQVQENKVSMWAAVIAHLDANPTIWNLLPAFVNTYQAFKDQNNLIAPYLNRQQQKTKGVTKNKLKLEGIAISHALPIIANIRVYAADIQDDALLQNIYSTKSQLEKLPDTELATRLMYLHDTALTLLPQMANYGNTAAGITDFHTAILAYTASIPKPRNTASEKRTATQFIVQTLKTGTTLLENLDLLALNFKTQHPIFYSDYKTNREIIDHAHHYTRVEITLLDAQTQLPVENATVIISDSDCGIVKTDNNGIALIKPVSPGIHTLNITHPDYTDLTISNIKLQAGKTRYLILHITPL